MTGTNNVMEITIESQKVLSESVRQATGTSSGNEVDILMEEVQKQEGYVEIKLDRDTASAKSEKTTKSKRRTSSSTTSTSKKQYTEDSIRLYLQEIGRIRLLRADEEIELARKIADLLELEQIREQFMLNWDREPQDWEWAQAVDMELLAFKRRLHGGRRAKEKMVQSNLRLVVSIAKKYMNRGLSFQDLIQEGSLDRKSVV